MINAFLNHTCCGASELEGYATTLEGTIRDKSNISLRLRSNAIVNYDPTRTLTLRNRFVKEMEKRFKWLKRQIRQKIVTENFLSPNSDIRDIFGLKENAPRYKYSHSASKVSSFKRWLNEQVEEGILETSTREGVLFTEQAWTNEYIKPAYEKGISRARQEMRKAGMKDIPPLDSISGTLRGSSLSSSVHADRVGLLYTRTFSDLKGVTDVLDSQISRVLAEGMVNGLSPRVIANNMHVRVDKIGIVRARTIARTEIIRAHHEANINEYELAGIEEVTVLAEWVTAGLRVCPICSANEGEVFKLDEMRGLIPAHPNCRCVAVPVVLSPKEKFRTKGRAAVGIKKGKLVYEKFKGKRTIIGKG